MFIGCMIINIDYSGYIYIYIFALGSKIFNNCIKIRHYVSKIHTNIFWEFLFYFGVYNYKYIYILKCFFFLPYSKTKTDMRTSWSQGRINHLKLIRSSRPLLWHKPELSSIISKKVVYNYQAFIFVEKILSGIDIKGIVTSYNWTEKEGIFMWYAVWWIIFTEIICSFGGWKWT